MKVGQREDGGREGGREKNVRAEPENSRTAGSEEQIKVCVKLLLCPVYVQRKGPWCNTSHHSSEGGGSAAWATLDLSPKAISDRDRKHTHRWS